jgi:hypothetical protein
MPHCNAKRAAGHMFASIFPTWMMSGGIGISLFAAKTAMGSDAKIGSKASGYYWGC